MQADPKKVLRYLKTVRGQLDGIIQMVEDDRYCIDISNQVMASTALLNKANRLILEAHINHCIKDALNNGDEAKVKEVLDILEKLNR